MNLGSILGAVAGIVLMATGIGVVAGAMLLASSLASGGIIGGSIGKFMNSGLGRGLMAAVSLGSAAYAMYGSSAIQAGQTAAAQTTQASAAAGASQAGGAVVQDASIVGSDMANAAVATNSSFIQSAGMGADVAQVAQANPALSEVSGVSKETLNAVNQPLAAGPGAEASQASAAATSADAKAVDPLVSHGYASTSGVPESGAAGAGTPAATGLPEGQEAVDAKGMIESDQAGMGTPGTPAAGATTSGGGGIGGMLSSALNSKAGPAMVSGVGSMLGGIGSGMAQKQAMEDQLRAQEWGNTQWQNQGQVAQMQSAAAKPITVPQGYLQRAQQVRNLMAGNSGMQPLPTAQPGAPLAPSPLPPAGH